MIRDITNELTIKHGGVYTYNIIDYVNNKQIIDITCKIHGIFKMSVSQHLKGYGCPYCSGNKITNEEVILKMTKVHKGYYDYSLSKWKKKSDLIEIICPLHGIFKQSLSVHIAGHKCQKCSNRYIKSNNDFIKICKSIEPEIVTSITKYTGTSNPVNFICKNHGIIKRWPQSITDHICSKCYKINKNKDIFFKKCNYKFGDRYDYSLSEYKDMQTPIRIIDTKNNNIFNQTPTLHLKSINHITFWEEKVNTELFVTKSIEKHKDRYSYKNSEYNGSKSNIVITCPVHGDFNQTPNNHLRGAGCPKCNRFNIKESELLEFIKNNTDRKIKTSDRKILNGKEIDIYISELKIGFEFNGLYWHSDLYKSKYYHLEKTKECLKQDIQLLHIWEDDWTYKQDIVKSMIINKLGKTESRIFARKCEIKEISDNKLIRSFLEKNHIQGFVGSRIKLGLFYNNELVSLMTFGNLRKSLGQSSKERKYELLRFCNKLNTSVIGGASKLFKYFKDNYNVEEVISYSDLSRSNGNMYKKLGFRLIHESSPNYYYVINGNRKHRFNFRKDKLIREGYDPSKTEIEIMSDRGFYRIFDCGMQKWIFQ